MTFAGTNQQAAPTTVAWTSGALRRRRRSAGPAVTATTVSPVYVTANSAKTEMYMPSTLRDPGERRMRR